MRVQVRLFTWMSLLCCGLWLAGCRFDMSDQPRYEPFESSTLFADGASVRPRIADTVARNEPVVNDLLHSGRINGDFSPTFPFTITEQVLERGQQRYDIFCAPCHDLTGGGQGVVTEYGMRTPTSFHDPDLRAEPAGYYFVTITDGTRVMPSYASRIPVEDRWAIVAYIRALQLSQGADVNTLPAEDLSKLDQ